jgi:hypothetical protein
MSECADGFNGWYNTARKFTDLNVLHEKNQTFIGQFSFKQNCQYFYKLLIVKDKCKACLIFLF